MNGFILVWATLVSTLAWPAYSEVMYAPLSDEVGIRVNAKAPLPQFSEVAIVWRGKTIYLHGDEEQAICSKISATSGGLTIQRPRVIAVAHGNKAVLLRWGNDASRSSLYVDASGAVAYFAPTGKEAALYTLGYRTSRLQRFERLDQGSAVSVRKNGGPK